MKIDNQTLTAIIMSCFDLASDDRVPEDWRPQFLAMGTCLRDLLVDLITADFEADTPKIKEASQKLRDVNALLRQEAQVLNDIANAIEQIGKLVGILDELLGLAIKFA